MIGCDIGLQDQIGASLVKITLASYCRHEQVRLRFCSVQSILIVAATYNYYKRLQVTTPGHAPTAPPPPPGSAHCDS